MEIDALDADRELMIIEKELNETELVLPLLHYHFEFFMLGLVYKSTCLIHFQKKKHFEEVMHKKVLSELEAAKATYCELEQMCKVHSQVSTLFLKHYADIPNGFELCFRTIFRFWVSWLRSVFKLSLIDASKNFTFSRNGKVNWN